MTETEDHLHESLTSATARIVRSRLISSEAFHLLTQDLLSLLGEHGTILLIRRDIGLKILRFFLKGHYSSLLGNHLNGHKLLTLLKTVEQSEHV